MPAQRRWRIFSASLFDQVFCGGSDRIPLHLCEQDQGVCLGGFSRFFYDCGDVGFVSPKEGSESATGLFSPSNAGVGFSDTYPKFTSKLNPPAPFSTRIDARNRGQDSRLLRRRWKHLLGLPDRPLATGHRGWPRIRVVRRLDRRLAARADIQSDPQSWRILQAIWTVQA